MDYSINQLSNINYSAWKKQIKCLMMQKDCQDTLTDDDVKDNKKQGTGLSIILSSLNLDDQNLVIDCTDVKSTMSKLEHKYGVKENEYALTEQMMRLEWTREESADQFINKVSDIRRKFQSIDANTKDDKFIFMILNKLPKGMIAIKSDFDYRIKIKEELITYSKFCSHIISEYQSYVDRMKDINKHVSSTRNKSGDVAYTIHRKNCKKCGSNRHPTHNCPQNNRYHQLNQTSNYHNTNNANNNHYNRNSTQYDSQPRQYGSRNNQCQNNNQYRNDNQHLNISQHHNNNQQNQNNHQPNNNPNDRYSNNYRQNRPYHSRNNQNNANNEENDVTLVTLLSQDENDERKFKLDNGSSIHVTNDIRDFHEYQQYECPINISGIADAKALGQGTVKAISIVDNEELTINLQNVRYIPTIVHKIISENILEDKGCIITNHQSNRLTTKQISLNNRIIIQAKRPKFSNLIFRTDVTPIQSNTCNTTNKDYHEIFAHRNQQQIYKTSKCVNGMHQTTSSTTTDSCDSCCRNKQVRRNYNHNLLKDNRPGYKWHTDINELPFKSKKGKSYAIHFTDEATRFKRVDFLSKQSATEILNAIERNILSQQDELGYLPAVIHSDKGAGYMSKSVQNHLWNQYKIRFTTSTSHNHEQNGLSEKVIQDITRDTRTIMHSTKVPNFMWAEAYKYATYTSNYLYQSAIGKTPYEALYQQKPDVSHLKKFNEPVYRLIPSKFRNKMQPTSELMKFVGYTNNTVNYRLSTTDYSKVIEDCNVKFLNDQRVKIKLCDEDDPVTDQDSLSNNENENDEDNEREQHQSINKESDDTIINKTANTDQTFDFAIHKSDVTIPNSISQVYENRHEQQFLEAMDREVLQWLSLDAIELVPRPDNTEILRGHWRYSIKSDDNDHVTKFKARYVIDGSELDETKYAPTPRYSSITSLLSYATCNNYFLRLIDIQTAYLNANANEIRYMHQIKSYEDPDRRDYVAMIKKASYGLPDSAYLWYSEISKCLINYGLNVSKSDGCVFYLKDLIFVIVHSDDILVLSNNEESCNSLIKHLKSYYSITVKDEVNKYLGVQYKYFRDPGRLYLFQVNKIDNLFEKYKPLLPKATKLPVPQDANYYKESPLSKDTNTYQSIIGSLNYISTRTRPDISVYVSILSKFLKCPTDHHLQLAYRIISYLHQSRKRILKYSNRIQDLPLKLHTYADASNRFAIQDTGKCTSGITVMLNDDLIYWSSAKQSAVADEICYAELFALNQALKQTLSIRNLLLETSVINNKSVIHLYCDNSSAISIGEDGLKTGSSHYHNKLLFVRDFLNRGECVIKKVPTIDNLADILTKPPTHAVLNNFVDNVKLILSK